MELDKNPWMPTGFVRIALGFNGVWCVPLVFPCRASCVFAEFQLTLRGAFLIFVTSMACKTCNGFRTELSVLVWVPISLARVSWMPMAFNSCHCHCSLMSIVFALMSSAFAKITLLCTGLVWFCMDGICFCRILHDSHGFKWLCVELDCVCMGLIGACMSLKSFRMEFNNLRVGLNCVGMHVVWFHMVSSLFVWVSMVFTGASMLCMR